MQKAAKQETFLLWIIASAVLFCAPSFASSTHDLHSENRVEIFKLGHQNGVGQQAFDAAKHVENYDSPWGVASESSVAPKGPAFKSWNEFQAGTTGQFASRAEAAKAWGAYKQANGIVTGTVRSAAAKRNFLKGLADDANTPSWMKQWLREGKVPPGYDVDHIKPLSIGGADAASNMRLQLRELHQLHHRFYRPWE